MKRTLVGLDLINRDIEFEFRSEKVRKASPWSYCFVSPVNQPGSSNVRVKRAEIINSVDAESKGWTVYPGIYGDILLFPQK